jgi:hypothetical protein
VACEYERRKSSAILFLLVLFRAAIRDLGTDLNAKVTGQSGRQVPLDFVTITYFSKSLMPFCKAGSETCFL